MPDIGEVKENLKQAGFAAIETELYEIRHDLEDMFLYGGKHSPRLIWMRDSVVVYRLSLICRTLTKFRRAAQAH